MPVEGVVAMLEHLLEEAKAGQIQNIGAVWIGPDLVPMDAYAGGGAPHEVTVLVGAVEIWKLTVLTGVCKATEQPFS